jgi:hypothetical protein
MARSHDSFGRIILYQTELIIDGVSLGIGRAHDP